jgi:hypothetical protein
MVCVNRPLTRQGNGMVCVNRPLPRQGNGMVCVNRPLTRQGNGMVCMNRPLKRHGYGMVCVNRPQTRTAAHDLQNPGYNSNPSFASCITIGTASNINIAQQQPALRPPQIEHALPLGHVHYRSRGRGVSAAGATEIDHATHDPTVLLWIITGTFAF